MRLGIISALAANEKLSFTELKNLLNTTDTFQEDKNCPSMFW